MRAFAVLLVALLGCVEQPTQVLVRLATDIPDIDTVVLRIYDDEEALVREQVLPPDRLTAIPADGRFHPIGTFGLVPQDGDANRRFRVVVDVTVRRSGTVRFETRARSGFVKGNSIRLDIFIAELCIDLAEMCEEEGLTCGIDGCVPEDIPPESLPPIDDDPIPDDPIDPRRHDAGVRDTGVLDGGVDAPVVPDAAFDAATDTMGVDVGFFDGGLDAGVDAAFDGGMDAGGFDAGPLVPGVDDAPVVFPWAGYRDEDGEPRIAFREIPGAVRYFATFTDYITGTRIHFEPITASGPGIREVLITGISLPPTGGRRFRLQLQSCDGPDMILDCNAPLDRPWYIDLGRVRCDLDNDGDSEIIATQSNGTLNVWMNGPGAAPVTIDPHVGTGATVAACADLDGDGNAEVVSLQTTSGGVGIVGWTGSVLQMLGSPFTATATTMIAGDFDADGFEDVVFADANNGLVRYARGSDTGPGPTLLTPVAITRLVPDGVPAGRYGRDLAATDLDADGFLDLIIADANHVDDVSKTDTGLQLCYGGLPGFTCTYFPMPVMAADQHFGASIAGLGVADDGRGGFAVAAPEAGAGNTGRVYEYQSGAGSPVAIDSPVGAAMSCCFPSDLTPGPRDFGTARRIYYAGYGDYDVNHFGLTFRCTGSGCAAINPPANVAESFFGFDVMGDLSGDRLAALSRAPSQNGVYVYNGAWTRATGSPTVDDLTRLAE